MEESRGALLFQKVCHILNIILKVAVMVIIAFPFYWMVSTSLKDYTEALQFPPTYSHPVFTGKTTLMYLRSFPLDYILETLL